MYKELDNVIGEYVGMNEEADGNGVIHYDCADPHLHDSITNECNMYLDEGNHMPFDYLSDDAKQCITEWEELMKDTPLVNFDERSDH